MLAGPAEAVHSPWNEMALLSRCALPYTPETVYFIPAGHGI